MEKMFLKGQVKRETEKAVLLETPVENAAGIAEVKVWFPKSQIEVKEDGIEAPFWLLKAKIKDVEIPGQHWFFYAPEIVH